MSSLDDQTCSSQCFHLPQTHPISLNWFKNLTQKTLGSETSMPTRTILKLFVQPTIWSLSWYREKELRICIHRADSLPKKWIRHSKLIVRNMILTTKTSPEIRLVPVLYSPYPSPNLPGQTSQCI